MKLSIWEDVADDPRTEWGANINHGGIKKRLSPYCLVSREWHEFFASRLFRRLTVSKELEFSQLRQLGFNQKKFVKHIWLRIDLATYPCELSWAAEDAVWHGKNIGIVERTLEKFFDEMAWYGSWLIDEPDESYGGMTLEISIHSPSDREHCFRGFYDFDAEPNLAPSWPLGPCFVAAGHPVGAAQYNQQDAIVPYLRLFGYSALDARMNRRLFVLRFITRLVVRRQTRRRLTPPAACLILKALPNLEEVAVEFWREFSVFEQARADCGEDSPCWEYQTSCRRPPLTAPQVTSSFLSVSCHSL